MSRTHVTLRRCGATAVLLGALAICAERGLAQVPPAAIASQRLAALVGMPPTAESPTAARGPLARLVRNPQTTDGKPPYALADQAGAVQRYVEPVPGIDLEPYVGRVVTVRYDTGETLLASQLDLPILPTVMSGTPGPAQTAAGFAAPASGVRLAQHVEPLADDSLSSDVAMPGDALDVNGVEPIYLDSMSPAMMGMPAGAGMGPGLGACSTCDGACHLTGCGSIVGAGCTSCAQEDPWRLYADVDLNVFRVRVAEDPNGIGKLSEHYDLSPRVIVGTENPWLDARVRYWWYHETTPVLNNGGGDVRFELDVLDIEATTRLQGRRSDVTLAGGIRLADLDLNVDVPRLDLPFATGNDMIGVTLAADAQTRMFSGRLGQWGVVYGGRLSLLGGDWGGDVPRRDDNVVVYELYGGVEYLYSFEAFDVHARVTAEWQNWRSDALAAGGIYESIGFFGPSAQLGVDF